MTTLGLEGIMDVSAMESTMIPQDTTSMASDGDETHELNLKSQTSNLKSYHTPAQIINSLPKTATPWQQDSAIRANYKFKERDWLHEPNPMRTPTTKADPEMKLSLDKPMYYSHSLVQPDSIYRPEEVGHRPGVAGDPVPYTIANDNLITSLLFVCFVFAAIAIANGGNFLQRQTKNFFRTPRKGTTVITETSSELRFQLFLMAQTCLLAAIIFFFYSRDLAGYSFSIAHYQVLEIFTGAFAAYFFLKALVYATVDWVFFDKKKNEQWLKAFLFLSSTEGIALFPVVLLLAYFNLSIHTTVIYALIVVIIAKILAFYKTYIIFFKRNGAIVQIFLYFCALELMPLGTLWGVLAMLDNYFKQFF